jgi:membrane peptidoglycan carboxypeptidase
MREQFGSKRRAKEEIFSTFTVDDAGKAALLAGIAKSRRDDAPSAKETRPILRRRNQILTLMAAQGFISRDQMTKAGQRPLPQMMPREPQPFRSSAVVAHVLDEFKMAH